MTPSDVEGHCGFGMPVFSTPFRLTSGENRQEPPVSPVETNSERPSSALCCSSGSSTSVVPSARLRVSQPPIDMFAIDAPVESLTHAEIALLTVDRSCDM